MNKYVKQLVEHRCRVTSRGEKYLHASMLLEGQYWERPNSRVYWGELPQ